MTGFLAWVVDRLRWLLVERLVWLLLLAVVIGPVGVYIGWSEMTRIRDIEASGVEATARVEGATSSEPCRSSTEDYMLKLSWRDARGTVQTHDSVTISDTFAGKIIVNNGISIVRDTVRIKYLPEATETEPIMLDDAARQQGDDYFTIWLGAGIFTVGAVGSGLMFLLGRRRRWA